MKADLNEEVEDLEAELEAAVSCARHHQEEGNATDAAEWKEVADAIAVELERVRQLLPATR